MSGAPMWRRIQRMLGPDPENDVDDELRHHLELRARELVARGMAPEEARREALRRFGDLERVRREVIEIERRVERRSRAGSSAAELAQDIRLSLRGLGRTPGFAAAAILTLALGIGANVAVFSAVDSVVLRPLPFDDPDRLVMLWEENADKGWEMETVAASNMLDWRERVGAFTDIAAYSSFEERVTMSDAGEEPRAVTAGMATGNLFEVLGVAPAAGRLFRFEETWVGTERVALLTHDEWVRSYGGDAGAVGRVVTLDDESHRIVGVLPEEFRFPGSEARVWIPIGWNPEARAMPSFRRAHWLRAVARLRPGATLRQAESELRAVARQLEVEYPETNTMMGAGLTPLHDFLLGDVGDTMLIVLAAVVLLLLLACANVGNLVLVRALSKRREIAVRAALGAGRMRLLRHAFAESLVLASLGAAGGLLLAWGALEVLGRTGEVGLLDGFAGLRLDPLVAGYLLALTLGSALLFGILPTLMVGSGEMGEALREGGRSGGASRSARRTSAMLVTGEVALAVLLVTGAALLTRSFSELRNVDPGFQDAGVMTALVSLPESRYDTDERVASAIETLRQRFAALPGVEDAAAVRQLPLTGSSWTSDFSVDGRGPEEYGVEVVHREVTPRYFETLRVPLLRGRTFADTDRAGAEPVLVINEALADRYFSGQDPIGARIAFSRAPSENETWWTVVGVVGNEKQAGPGDPARIEVFAPVAQSPTSGMSFVIRSDVESAALAAAVRQAVREYDPQLVLDEVRTLSEIRSAATAREEFLALLFASFAAVALVLAMVGVYGVMAQSIRAREKEISIRLALGAARKNVLGMLARYSGGILLMGITIGIIAAAIAAEALSALLFGIAPRDPGTLASSAALLLAAGLLAAALPALRALRTDPAAVLREE